METLTICDYYSADDGPRGRNDTRTESVKRDYVVYEIEKLFKDKLKQNNIELKDNTLYYTKSTIMSFTKFSVTFPPQYKDEIIKMLDRYEKEFLEKELESKLIELEMLNEDISSLKSRINKIQT